MAGFGIAKPVIRQMVPLFDTTTGYLAHLDTRAVAGEFAGPGADSLVRVPVPLLAKRAIKDIGLEECAAAKEGMPGDTGAIRSERVAVWLKIQLLGSVTVVLDSADALSSPCACDQIAAARLSPAA